MDEEVLKLLFKYMPMVQLLFNALCMLQNELIFVVSNLFISKSTLIQMYIGLGLGLGLGLYQIYQNLSIAFFDVNLRNKLYIKLISSYIQYIPPLLAVVRYFTRYLLPAVRILS